MRREACLRETISQLTIKARRREDTRMHYKTTIASSVRLTETGVEQQIDFMGEITRRFVEVSQQQMEAGLRKKLIELGWTPPNEPVA